MNIFLSQGEIFILEKKKLGIAGGCQKTVKKYTNPETC